MVINGTNGADTIHGTKVGDPYRWLEDEKKPEVQAWMTAQDDYARGELAKLASQYAEKARVAVRNVRRDGMDVLKQDEKKHEISEDERKRLETEVQKLTDDTIKEIDAAMSAKEKEILQR